MTLRLSDFDNEKPYRRIQRNLSTGTTDEWIILDGNDAGYDISVGIVIKTTGAGSVEYTFEDIESIEAETAQGITWVAGTVSATKQSCFPSGVTGLRFVRDSGTIKGVISI